MEEKQYLQINIATNFNQKLMNDFFIHIAPMPPKPADEMSYYKSMLGVMCAINTKDSSYQGVKCQIIDWLAEYKVKNVPEIFILLSHGMRRAEFQQRFLDDFRNLNGESQVAIFYFRKIEK